MMRWLEPEFHLRHKQLLTCAPSPPPAPDYMGAAQQQGAANVKAIQTQGKINNPNVITPYGTQSVEWGTGFDQAGYDKATAKYAADKAAFDAAYKRWDLGDEGYQRSIMDGADPIGGQGNFDFLGDLPGIGGLFGGGGRGPREGPFDLKAPKAVTRDSFILNPNQATIRQQFSPEQQKIYDQQVKVKQLLGALGIQGSEALQGIVGRPLDFSGLPAMPGNAEGTRNKVIDAMMSRVNQDTDIAKDNTNSDLIAAGIRPGSKAYDNKMHMIDRSYNDARNQAFLASGQEASRDFGLDSERRRQAITEMLSQRQVPLNEITALMSGSQVQNPFSVPGYGGVGQPQAAPIFAAQNALSGYNTDLYNAGAAGAANQQQGLMGLGSTAIMGGALMF